MSKTVNPNLIKYSLEMFNKFVNISIFSFQMTTRKNRGEVYPAYNGWTPRGSGSRRGSRFRGSGRGYPTPEPVGSGAVVFAKVEEEGYPLTRHTTRWVMVRVPQEKWVTKNPLHKWRSRSNLNLKHKNEGREAQPDRQRHPEPSTEAWLGKFPRFDYN